MIIQHENICQKQKYGIFVKIETSGLDYINDRITELAIKAVNLKTGEELTSFNTVYEDEGMAGTETTEKIIQLFKKNKLNHSSACFFAYSNNFTSTFFSRIISPKNQSEHNFPKHWLDIRTLCSTALFVANAESTPRWHIRSQQFSKKALLNDFSGVDSGMKGVDTLIRLYYEVQSRLRQ
ncbi:MAG: hypothetical protein VX777_04920 [Chlamydiota bacterium]|nr:hypothetical protein [Chlamydiota bacterium]